jgi:septal ring factor EnvC (AmiA/AmiB activator)
MRGWLSRKDRKIANLEAMVKNRDKLIDRILEQNRALAGWNNDLVEEKRELRKQNVDYLNNIEFLVNNLSAVKKKQLGL